ncbi:MAG: ABC transporter substrate-binding protein, partial [bacterium]
MQQVAGGWAQWGIRLFRKFSIGERLVLLGLTLVLIVSASLAAYTRARGATYQPASGGVFTEGMVGSPQYINPLLAGTNDVDKTLSRLIYSGLTKIGPGREALPDLATSWEMFDQGKSYVLHLRDNAVWHDGEKFTADDVMYTFNALQAPDFAGVIKSTFVGVVAEKVDNYTVKITWPSPSAFSLYNL